jgi:hypothetical protein
LQALSSTVELTNFAVEPVCCALAVTEKLPRTGTPSAP